MDKENDIIKIAQKALRDSKLREQNVPDIILQLLEEDNWRTRKLENLDEVKEYEYFPNFVAAPLPYGLDTDWDVVQKLIKGYPKVELEVAHVLTNPHGVHHKTDDVANGNIIVKKTKTQRELQRLENERPDLLEKIEKGELSVYAASKEAGFRKPRMEVRPEPSQVAKAIKERFSAEQIAELIQLLMS